MATKAKTTAAASKPKSRSTKAAPKATTARRKSTTPVKTSAKTSAKPATTTPVVEPVAATPVAEPVVMRRATLVEETAKRGDLRKNQVKSVLDAALPVIGEALARGETLILPGLGKLTVQRIKDKENARLIITKLRQAVPGDEDKAAAPLKTALEAAAE